MPPALAPLFQPPTRSGARRPWAAALCSLALWLLALPVVAQAAAPTVVRVPPFDAPRDGRPGYFFEVLALALRKTEPSDGPFEVRVVNRVISLERAVLEVKKHQSLDLVFTAPNPGLTEGLRAIPVSLLKELNNYRILLIRAGEQARFDSVRTVQDLQAFTAGLGLQWVDTKILRHNGFKVEGAALHENLFTMLAAKRFDFFPRGLYEVQSDFRQHRHLGLALEERLLLHYEAPFYFFVRADNVKLAERIERGLRMALADGSFDRLLTSYPEFKAALALQENSRRRTLRLASPPSACRAGGSGPREAPPCAPAR